MRKKRTSIKRPPLYNSHFCEFPRVAAKYRFDCIYIHVSRSKVEVKGTAFWFVGEGRQVGSYLPDSVISFKQKPMQIQKERLLKT